MNRQLIRRWINEYMDGEIGLADKAELERIMAADDAVRQEYRELRQIGLLMGTQPEVDVHPHRFRLKLSERLDAESAPYFTPQRAFAASMLVVLLVISITFAFYAFQQREFGDASQAPAIVEANPLIASEVTLAVPASAEQFFTRLLIEHQLGLQENSVMQPLLTQTSVFEGAVCTQGGPLDGVSFQQKLPTSLHLDMMPSGAMKLSRFAADLTGQPVRLRVGAGSGDERPFEDYIRERGADKPVRLTLFLK